MATTYKQAYNNVLAAGDITVYTVPTATEAQIRALTIFNPTASTVTALVKLGINQFIEKAITTKSTLVVSELFNQQLIATGTVIVNGTGLNVILSVAEITK